MVQKDWWCLGSAGMQVQSLAQHSGLRIWHWSKLQLTSDPWPGNSISHRVAKK